MRKGGYEDGRGQATPSGSEQRGLTRGCVRQWAEITMLSARIYRDLFGAAKATNEEPFSSERCCCLQCISILVLNMDNINNFQANPVFYKIIRSIITNTIPKKFIQPLRVYLNSEHAAGAWEKLLL